MVNICESLINIVIYDKPKMLRGLSQKARGTERRLLAPSSQTALPPVERGDLTRSFGIHAKRGKPVTFPIRRESEPQGEPMKLRAEENGKSERRAVMARITVEPAGDITEHESGLTSVWSFITRELWQNDW